MNKWRDVFLDTTDCDVDALTEYGTNFAIWQRGCRWWIGDVARAARRKLGDNFSQVFPEWVSPGLIERCEAVAKAYPTEKERNPLASWTIHMREAKHSDRIQRVKAHVDAGRNSDEARKHKEPDRWLLAVDVNYYVHKHWHSGAGVEAATNVATWIQRTSERLKEKGLTDVACCFDSKTNHRKVLTANWEHKYKDRPKKDLELSQQITLARQLLDGHGFACVDVEGMEADDCMASYAVQFPGNVTLLTQDKDLRQCLSGKCNMLLDVEWDKETEAHEYRWLSAKQHMGETGILPRKWTEFQMLMGDNVDGIKGAVGIGEKGAKDLILKFGTVEQVIQAAKDEHPDIPEKKRKALIEFEAVADVTRQLVTMRTDLDVPMNTRIVEPVS